MLQLLRNYSLLLPNEDAEVARKLENLFKKRGIQVFTSKDASEMNLADFKKVLICVGRKPNLDSLELDNIGLTIKDGAILTDEYLTTNIKNIYAAGDCTAKIMLAHYAAYQSILAVKNLANPENKIKFSIEAVPNCIFTDPEISSVGMNEETAKLKNVEIEIKKFDFLGSPMAKIINETDGFIKIIYDKNTKNILGSSIIGPKATELIANLTLAVASRLTIEQLQNVIFAHPTISEAFGLTIN